MLYFVNLTQTITLKYKNKTGGCSGLQNTCYAEENFFVYETIFRKH